MYHLHVFQLTWKKAELQFLNGLLNDKKMAKRKSLTSQNYTQGFFSKDTALFLYAP